MCSSCTSPLHSLSAESDEARNRAPLALTQHLQAAAKHLICGATTDGHTNSVRFSFFSSSFFSCCFSLLNELQTLSFPPFLRARLKIIY